MAARFRIRPDTLDSVRPRPPMLRALGKDDPPSLVEINGDPHQLVRIFKHDSWAATALYQGPAGLVVCKFNRRQRIGLIPMRWLGWLLARRETHFLCHLAELPNVPRWSGDVFADGKRLANAVAHEYVPGRPLRYDEPVGEAFFASLEAALAEIHRRGMAYVDLHKPENVLVGEDGEPYLVDFQIGFALPGWWPANSALGRGVLRMLQQSDVYHLQKHIVQHSYRGAARSKNLPVPPAWIRAHRLVAVPFRTWRRGLLVKLGVRGRNGKVETEQFVEEGRQAKPNGAAA